MDLYLYERQGDEWVIVDRTWRNVRDSIAARMANFGNPTILVEDGDYHRNGELYCGTFTMGRTRHYLWGKDPEHIHVLGAETCICKPNWRARGLCSYTTGKHSREAM